MTVLDVWHKVVFIALAVLLLLQLCVSGEIWKYGDGQIEIYPADNQLISYSLPTPAGWLKTHWYIVLVVVLLIVICIVSTIPSVIVWTQRVKEHKAREQEVRNLSRVGSLTSSLVRQSFRSNTQHMNKGVV